MKVGILTLSASDNCGSLLQSYALMKILQNMGNEVEVIDFIPRASAKMYRTFHPGYIREPKKFIGQFLRYKSLIEQKKAYQEFRNREIKLTSKKYKTVKAMKKLDGKYEIIIVGSDQVWNIHMRDFNTAFFLSWCNKSKRVSYAASLGDQKNIRIQTLVDEGLELEKFEAVSVRESSAAMKFKSELGVNVELCLDPTLLLSKGEWEDLTDRALQPKEDFIFYYSYNYGNEEENNLVKQFSEITRLPVYVINASRWVDGREKDYDFKVFHYAGPLAFLNLMTACKYSMVESFHGCIFSYIFEKQFWFLEDKPKVDDRIEDLLQILDHQDRILRSGDVEQIDFSKTIDYKAKSKKFSELQEISLGFIKRNLKNEGM